MYASVDDDHDQLTAAFVVVVRKKKAQVSATTTTNFKNSTKTVSIPLGFGWSQTLTSYKAVLES